MEETVRRLVRDELWFRTKLAVLEYARECGNNAKAWREFEIPKSTFYLWKKAFERRKGRAEKEETDCPYSPQANPTTGC